LPPYLSIAPTAGGRAAPPPPLSLPQARPVQGRAGSRRQGGSSPSTSSSADAGEGRISAAGRLLSLYLELGRCRGGPDPALARADPATAASLRHGGAGPVAGRRGGRWTRALRGSRPVGRRRRLRLCEADCAWEGGDGCRAARGRRTRGGGGSLGRAVSMANWQGYVSISQFPAHLIWDTRTRHGYVSVPYPYRIRIRHGIRVYPGVSVFLRLSHRHIAQSIYADIIMNVSEYVWLLHPSGSSSLFFFYFSRRDASSVFGTPISFATVVEFLGTSMRECELLDVSFYLFLLNCLFDMTLLFAT